MNKLKRGVAWRAEQKRREVAAWNAEIERKTSLKMLELECNSGDPIMASLCRMAFSDEDLARIDARDEKLMGADRFREVRDRRLRYEAGDVSVLVKPKRRGILASLFD